MSRRGQDVIGKPQPVDFPGGGNHAEVFGHGDSPSPSSLLFRVTWAEQRSSEWDGLVTDGENSQVWGMVVPGCLSGEQCIFCTCCIYQLGGERIVPYSVGGPTTFFVFLFILVWARHGCRATIWRAVLATARSIVEGYRSPNEALGVLKGTCLLQRT